MNNKINITGKLVSTYNSSFISSNLVKILNCSIRTTNKISVIDIKNFDNKILINCNNTLKVTKNVTSDSTNGITPPPPPKVPSFGNIINTALRKNANVFILTYPVSYQSLILEWSFSGGYIYPGPALIQNIQRSYSFDNYTITSQNIVEYEASGQQNYSYGFAPWGGTPEVTTTTTPLTFRGKQTKKWLIPEEADSLRGALNNLRSSESSSREYGPYPDPDFITVRTWQSSSSSYKVVYEPK